MLNQLALSQKMSATQTLTKHSTQKSSCSEAVTPPNERRKKKTMIAEVCVTSVARSLQSVLRIVEKQEQRGDVATARGSPKTLTSDCYAVWRESSETSQNPQRRFSSSLASISSIKLHPSESQPFGMWILQ